MDQIKNSFEKVIEQARKDQAQVELLVSGGENLSLSYQQKKLQKFESTQSQMAGFRVILGGRQGYAYTENLAEDSLLRTYKEALNNAKTLQGGAEEIQLLKPQSTQAMSNLFSSQEIDMEKKLQAARELEECCLASDPRVQSVPYSGFNESVSFRRILNSAGLDQEFKQSYYSGYAYPLAKEGESSKMKGEGFFARTFNEVQPQKVAASAAKKATSLLGARTLTTGNYATVIDRDVFTTVLNMISGSLSAKSVFEKKSLFQGKLGQAVASSQFELWDDPFELRGSAVRPFDSEGAPSQKTPLIQGGVLKNYLTNTEYAKKMNLPHTAHASRSPASSMDIDSTNLIVNKGTSSLEDLLKSHNKVVHITDFAGGLHAGYNFTTGDISMPAQGFLYENGVCVGPVDQFVVSGNVMDLLMNIEAVGNEWNKPGESSICPDVLIKSLSYAGAS